MRPLLHFRSAAGALFAFQDPLAFVTDLAHPNPLDPGLYPYGKSTFWISFHKLTHFGCPGCYPSASLRCGFRLPSSPGLPQARPLAAPRAQQLSLDDTWQHLPAPVRPPPRQPPPAPHRHLRREPHWHFCQFFHLTPVVLNPCL